MGRRLLSWFGVLLKTLVLMELILQAASLLYHLGADTDPDVRASLAGESGVGEYRILCLGESTTQGFGQTPYPLILQRKLNRLGAAQPFKVINAGFVSAPTPYLVSQLESLLDTHDPQIVIVMMGVNDQFYFTDASPLTVDTQMLLMHLKTYKLLRMLWYHLQAEESVADVTVAQADPEAKRTWRRVLDQRANGRFEEARQLVLELIASMRAASRPEPQLVLPKHQVIYYNCYSMLLKDHLDAGRADLAVELFREALAYQGETEFFCRGLATAHEHAGDLARAREYHARALALAKREVLDVTMESYRRIQQILRGRGVGLVALQYPLRDVSILRDMLGAADDVIYVDQSKLFRQALVDASYDELFIDRFAGDFGHCTERGNRLIAENLVKHVFAPMLGL